MADNYLERRMDEYRRSQQGAATRRAAMHTSPTLKPGQAIIEYPPMRVLVTDIDTPAAQAVINALRQVNCRVAITGRDHTLGNRLAQKSGAQYHPDEPKAAIERLAKAGDPVILAVTFTAAIPDVPTLTPPREVLDAGPEATAAWVLYAAHPTSRHLYTRTVIGQ